MLGLSPGRLLAKRWLREIFEQIDDAQSGELVELEVDEPVELPWAVVDRAANITRLGLLSASFSGAVSKPLAKVDVEVVKSGSQGTKGYVRVLIQ